MMQATALLLSLIALPQLPTQGDDLREAYDVIAYDFDWVVVPES